MLENLIYLMAWPLVLVLSLFAMAGLLHIAGWLEERYHWMEWFSL